MSVFFHANHYGMMRHFYIYLINQVQPKCLLDDNALLRGQWMLDPQCNGTIALLWLANEDLHVLLVARLWR